MRPSQAVLQLEALEPHLRNLCDLLGVKFDESSPAEAVRQCNAKISQARQDVTGLQRANDPHLSWMLKPESEIPPRPEG